MDSVLPREALTAPWLPPSALPALERSTDGHTGSPLLLSLVQYDPETQPCVSCNLNRLHCCWIIRYITKPRLFIHLPLMSLWLISMWGLLVSSAADSSLVPVFRCVCVCTGLASPMYVYIQRSPGVTVRRVANSRTWLKQFSTFTCIHKFCVCVCMCVPKGRIDGA